MRTRLLLFLTLCLSAACTRHSRVIDYPVIDNKNTNTMEVYRVELTDTATILYVEMYNLPNYWVRLSSGACLEGTASGKKYRLLKSPDFELDKEVYMPESGNAPATLFFEPVDKDEEAVSFIEGTGQGDFRIEGIHLKKQPARPGTFECVLEGEVIDRPESSRLTLMRAGKDVRTTPFVSIPVRNGKFSYTLTADVNETYELVFWDEYQNGSWRSTSFIAEQGTLHFVLYPMEHRPHSVLQAESPLNKEEIRIQEEIERLYPMNQLDKECDALEQEERYYSREMYDVKKRVSAAKTAEERNALYSEYDRLCKAGKEYSDEGIALNKKYKEYSDGSRKWQLDYIRKEPTLNGLCRLKQMFDRAVAMNRYEPGKEDISVYREIFEHKYRDTFSAHPYVTDMERAIASLDVKVGGFYVDFSAPDLDGNMVRLSEQIKGKVALIDLWASWCGPCRRLSVSMIPVYEAFKDKGFTVVGVARESNTDAMKKAIGQDKYPWLNLVELNDKGKIWEMYGAGNSGGCTYLVDKDGKILAVRPSAEEVTKILTELL